MKMEEMYRQGQLDLISKIKENVGKLVESEPSGFDLAMDLIQLLKSIKPVDTITKKEKS